MNEMKSMFDEKEVSKIELMIADGILVKEVTDLAGISGDELETVVVTVKE